MQAVADPETQADLCVKIAAVSERFAPERRWHIDTMISMLAAAGNVSKRVAVSQTLYLIAHAAEEHAAITHKLYSLAASAAHSASEAQQPLLQVAVWVIGEFGEALLKAPPPLSEDTTGPIGDVRSEAEVG